jgi:hypothetical protein
MDAEKEKAAASFSLAAAFSLLAEWTGLEPATPGVTGRYSNQLNYHSLNSENTATEPLGRYFLLAQALSSVATPRGFEPLLQP